MARLGVPDAALVPLGLLKAAGGVGLLISPLAPAAAIGLVLFFSGAIVTTLHARWYAHLPYPAFYLALAAAALASALTT